MKDRPWLSQLIIQPIMIVLSILAALGVNNWQESRALAKKVADTRAAFVAEITSNKQLLVSDYYLPHHKQLRDEYRKALEENTGDPNTLFKNGAHPVPLRDSAWRMLSGTASLMQLPPEFVLALSDIYQLQESIAKHNESFLNALSVPRSDRETPEYAKDVTYSVMVFLNDLVVAEERLLRAYDHALTRFSSSNAPWAEGKKL